MKKIAFAAFLGLALAATTASASHAKGKRVYQKFMKADCGKTGGTVAGKHTQAEWKKLYDGKKFQAELETICPASKKFIESAKFKKLQDHLFDFMYEFGKGSGNIPAC